MCVWMVVKFRCENIIVVVLNHNNLMHDVYTAANIR